jgi:hypothetical protein
LNSCSNLGMWGAVGGCWHARWSLTIDRDFTCTVSSASCAISYTWANWKPAIDLWLATMTHLVGPDSKTRLD